MKILDIIFSEIIISNIIEILEKVISDHIQQYKIKEDKVQQDREDKGLIIGLSVAGGVLALSALGGFLYWFFKVKK